MGPAFFIEKNSVFRYRFLLNFGIISHKSQKKEEI